MEYFLADKTVSSAVTVGTVLLVLWMPPSMSRLYFLVKPRSRKSRIEFVLGAVGLFCYLLHVTRLLFMNEYEPILNWNDFPEFLGALFVFGYTLVLLTAAVEYVISVIRLSGFRPN